jgi:hypothetical protein
MYSVNYKGNAPKIVHSGPRGLRAARCPAHNVLHHPYLNQIANPFQLSLAHPADFHLSATRGAKCGMVVRRATDSYPGMCTIPRGAYRSE